MTGASSWLLPLGVGLAAVGILALALVRLGRHRGMLWLRDHDGTLYRVSIQHLVTRTAHNEERSLNLVIACDGVFMELNVGDGSELLRDLYEGRVWLYELEAAGEESNAG